MVGKEGKEEIEIPGYHDPYYLCTTDNQTTQVGAMIFNGGNYLNWSRSVKMGLTYKNKLGYITGKVAKPKADYPMFF